MDFNPFLNKLITERNSAVVEDPLVDLLAEMVKAIVRLEAQQEASASASQPTEQPALSSSEATETAEETSDTWSISSTWSSPVSPAGGLLPSVVQAISAWLSTHSILGSVREVEIGVTLHSKGIIQPDGLNSSSRREEPLSLNGAAGESLPTPTQKVGH